MPLNDVVLPVIYLTSMFLSILVSLMYWKKLQLRYLLILALFLPYVFLQELIGMILIWIGYDFNTKILYNIYRPLTVVLFALIYYRIPIMKRWRLVIVLMATLYGLAIAWDYLLNNYHFTSNIYLTLARGFVISIFAILFLLSYFNLDTKEDEGFWRPVLWMTIGLIVFYPVISISIAFQEYLFIENVTFYGYKIYRMVPQVMSVIMYTCFSYAFYLCRLKN